MAYANWEEVARLYQSTGRGIGDVDFVTGEVKFNNSTYGIDQGSFEHWCNSGLSGKDLKRAFYDAVDAYIDSHPDSSLTDRILGYYRYGGSGKLSSHSTHIFYCDENGDPKFSREPGYRPDIWNADGTMKDGHTIRGWIDAAAAARSPEEDTEEPDSDEGDTTDEDTEEPDSDEGDTTDEVVPIRHYDKDGNYIGTWAQGRYPEWDLEGNWIGSEDAVPKDSDQVDSSGDTPPTSSPSPSPSPTPSSTPQLPKVDTTVKQPSTEIDHMDFGIKVQIATKIFEFTDKAYYGELFPLFAKLFAVVDAIAQKKGSPRASNRTLCVEQVIAMVNATLSAVQIPTLIDLANSSLSLGPDNPVGGAAFFPNEVLHPEGDTTPGSRDEPSQTINYLYPDCSLFAGVTKGTFYDKYREYEAETINEIADGTLDMLEPTGVSLTDPVALRNLTATTMAVSPRNEGSTGAANMDDSLASAKAFIAANAYEKFCGWYLTLLLPTMSNIFRFYKEFPAQWAIITELVSSWIIRDGGRYAVSEEAATEYFTRMSNYVDLLEEEELEVPSSSESEEEEEIEDIPAMDTP